MKKFFSAIIIISLLTGITLFLFGTIENLNNTYETVAAAEEKNMGENENIKELELKKLSAEEMENTTNTEKTTIPSHLIGERDYKFKTESEFLDFLLTRTDENSKEAFSLILRERKLPMPDFPGDLRNIYVTIIMDGQGFISYDFVPRISIFLNENRKGENIFI